MDSIASPALLSISVKDVRPTLTKDAQGNFSLQLDLQTLQLALRLDAAQVRTLGLMCLHHFPDIEPRYAVLVEEDAYRLPARKIAMLDDGSIQILLREIRSDALIDFLWYMKDPELAKLVFRNLSQRAAQMLFEDLESRHGGRHPDSAPQVYVAQARDATLGIIGIVDRLCDEGRIPKI